MTTCIRASYARLAMTAMAQLDIRFYLQGILVEPRKEGGAFIVATDGHRMMVIIDKDAKCDERIILKPDKATAAHLPKIDGKGDTGEAKLQLTTFNDKPALLVTDSIGQPLHLQIKDAVINEVWKDRKGGEHRSRFPNWRSVLPKFEKLKPGHSNHVRAEYVTAFLPAFSRNRKSRYTGMQSFQTAPEQVVAFHIAGYEHVLYLVMPMRDSHGQLQWISNWAPVQKPAAPAPAPAEGAPA